MRNEVFARYVACFRKKRQLSVTNRFDSLALSLHAAWQPITVHAEFAAIRRLVVSQIRARVKNGSTFITDKFYVICSNYYIINDDSLFSFCNKKKKTKGM